MNSLQDTLHFMSKCVNLVNSYLKEYLTKKNFIVFKSSQDQLYQREYAIKK